MKTETVHVETDSHTCPGKCGGTVFFSSDAVFHDPHPACSWFNDPAHGVLYIARAVRESLGLSDPNVVN